jgi:hypothetical protein
MNGLDREIDEIIFANQAAEASMKPENGIISFSCRFSLDKVAFNDSGMYADHSYQLTAQRHENTAAVTYRCGQHDERIPSQTYRNTVDGEIMKQIEEIIDSSDIRKYNGMHRITQGLPEGYGCALEVRYLYGPGLSLSNNSFLYFDVDFVQKLIRLFYRASGAMATEAGYRLNGVSYSIYEHGLCSFQAYLLLNQDETVDLEYYDRKNFITRKCTIDDAILDELDELWRENDLEYAGQPDRDNPESEIVVDMRFGHTCRRASSSCPLTDLQLSALENIRDIIDRHLAAAG